ncbi:hypothetical protein CQW32_17585 [Pseudomonas putida]|uniref:hypothetical protein n=1 Tax=Pseudomonas putida TaxID=303 RepID=UPI000C2A8595|nr:hypothetical protein [Pseudomonas putida]PJX09066.1 hypothetical protein CQW32_17585 [Pseudomonas putida]
MKVIALERGYYGGKIQDPPEAGGQPFDIQSESHLGKWMEPQGWTPSAAAKPVAITSAGTSLTAGSQGGGAQQPAFTVKHNGGGRHIVIDASGKKVGDFVGANKEEAQAEADRLIAGGEPYVKPDDTTAGSQGGGADGANGGNPDDDEGPDA